MHGNISDRTGSKLFGGSQFGGSCSNFSNVSQVPCAIVMSDSAFFIENIVNLLFL